MRTCWLRGLALALPMLWALAQPVRAAQSDYAGFDHLATGFPLDGQHLNLRCEHCHLRGIFSGLSKRCSSCHIQGGALSAMFMPPAHIPTQSAAFRSSDCTDCHTSNSFGGAHFAHANVTPGGCSICHNGVNAQGKSKNHIATTASCDGCHLTISFALAFEGYPPGHIPTTLPCQVCHSAGFSMTATKMVHTGITTGCTSCHAADAPGICPPPPLIFTMTMGTANNQPVTLTPTSQMCPGGTASAPHIVTAISCESCHTAPSAPIAVTGTIGLFAGGRMNHAGISGGCANCHADGKGPYRGLPGANVPALVTESTKGSHIPVNSTDCSQCHKSTTVPGGFAGTAMNHTGFTSSCNGCHENNATDLGYYGLTATLVVRPPVSGAQPNAVTVVDPGHPTTGDCAQCHSSTTNFNLGIALPANHIPTGSTACTNCHQGTAAPYAPVNTVMNHAGFTATCSGCHGAGKSFLGTAQTEAGGQPLQPPGTIGTPGAANHIPYGTADCVGCHSATSTTQGGFKIATAPALSPAGHAAVSSLACSTCHYFAGTAGNVTWFGTVAVGPPGAIGTSGAANHISLGTGDCSTCHGSTFTVGAFKVSSTPVLGTAGHAAVASVTCATCHGTGSAWYGAAPPVLVTQLANHIPIAGAGCNAGGCHGSNFATGGFQISGTPGTSPSLSVTGHTAVSSLTCASCHENNATDFGFQGVAAQIYLRPGPAVAGLSPVDVAHATGTLATSDCIGCHTTAAPFKGGANDLPTNHIPLPSSGAGSTCVTCHAVGFTPATSTMNHASVTSESCTTCHGSGKGPFAGSGPGTGGQPVQPPGTLGTSGAGNHIPVGASDCVACHAATDTESGTGFKIPAGTTPTLSTAGHTAVSTLTCATCHSSGMAWYGVTIVVPPGTVGTSGAANHIAVGSGDCVTCHGGTIAVGAFKTTSTPSLGSAGHAAVSSLSCATCHSAGSTWYGAAPPTLVTALSTHLPFGNAACSACHGSNFATGGFHISGTPGTASPVMSVASHAVATGALGNTCNSCHDGVLNPSALSFQGVGNQIYLRPGSAAMGLSPNDANHVTGTTSAGLSLASPTDCVNCHVTAGPFSPSPNAQPGNHIPLAMTNNCTTNCHKNGYAPATTSMLHSDPAVSSESCTSCHGSGTGPYYGTGPGAGGQPQQPPGTLGTSGAGNHIPVASADCKGCHTTVDGIVTTMPGTGFKLSSSPLLSSSGHATVNTLTCAACHGSGMAWYGLTIVVPPGTVGTSGAANHIALGAGDCSTCHGSTFAVGAFKISSTPSLGSAGHTAVSSLSCAGCHGTGLAWYGATPPALVTQLAAHIPIGTASCNASGCHSSNFVTGGFHISGTPVTSPVLSVTGHTAVSSLTCTSCHENNATDLAFQGVGSSIYLRPGTAVAGLSAIDNAHATGTLATADCRTCHTTTPPFQGNSSSLPANHIPLPSSGAGATCSTCHAAGFSPSLSKIVHSAVTAVAGGCTACHGSGKGPFAGSGPGTGGQPVQPPGTVGTSGAGNHIPLGAGDCSGCHASTDTESGTGFKLSSSPLLSTAGHTAVNTLTCATCHSSGMAWQGVTIVVPPGTVGTSGAANHIAVGTGDCVTCHGGTIAVGAFKIASTPSLASAGHAVVSSLSCASCHGTGSTWYGAAPPVLVTQLAAHIPIAGAGCNASGCHASNFVSGGFHISGTPGSSPVLSVTGHTVVASLTCVSCHENNASDASFQGVAGQIYLRPGAAVAGLSPVDAAHATGTLAAPNDCAGCHTTTPPFKGNTLPGNHFPLPTPQPSCATCHAAGYGVGKSIMVHSAVSGESCSLCHGSGKGPFSGTSQGTGGQPMQPPGTVGTSSTANHIPIASADCGTACHATADAMTGTGFKLTMKGSSSAHSAVSSLACSACHGTGLSWYGGTVKTPPGTPATFPCSGAACNPSASNHIPLPSEVCTICHASTGYTSFAGTAMNHAGISSGCAGCHGTGSAFYGVTMVTQLSTHIVFNSRTDCVTCHGQNFGTGGFKISASPVLSTANHSYVSTTCDNCHNNTAADLAFQGVGTSIYVRPGATAVGLSPADANHATGNLATQDCSGCHTTTPPFTGNTEPTNHIPTTAGANCAANCHKGGFTAAGTVMDHADASVSGTACVTCHGKGKGPFYGTAQSQAGGQPMQPPGTPGTSGTGNHIPMGPNGAATNASCNVGCHTAAPPTTAVSGGFSFAMKGNSAAHAIVVSGADCDYCHESGKAFYLDSTGGSSIRTRPSGHHTGTDCGSPNGCHAGHYSAFAGAAAAAAEVKAKAAIGLPKRIPLPATGTTPPPATGPTAKLAGTGPYSHLGVAPGGCTSCHSATGGASAMPAGHLPTTLSCNNCHRTTAWAPVAYAHAGVGPGRCGSCHVRPIGATPKPAGHFVTNRSCDVCHHSTEAWRPVMYDHLTPRYRPQPGMLVCRDCHTTNTEMVMPGPSKPGPRKASPGGAIRVR